MLAGVWSKAGVKVMMALWLLDRAGFGARAAGIREADRAGNLRWLPREWARRYDPERGVWDTLQAAHAGGVVYLNRAEVERESVIHVGEWLLDEAIHLQTPGDDTAAEHRVFAEERARYYGAVGG